LRNAGLWSIAGRALTRRPTTAPLALDPVREKFLGWLPAPATIPPAELAVALCLAHLWDVGDHWPLAERQAAAATLTTPADLKSWPPLRFTFWAGAGRNVPPPDLSALAAPFDNLARLTQWLEGLDWAQTRTATSHAADLAALLLATQRRDAAQHLLVWLNVHHHTDSGAWTFGHDIERVEALVAAAHCLPLYAALGQPLPEPAPLLAAVLAAQKSNGLFGPDAYADTLVLELMASLSRTTDHRASTVRLAARLAAQAVVRRQQPDGGFSGAPVAWLTAGVTPATPSTNSDQWSAWCRSHSLAALAARWPDLFAPTAGWSLRPLPETIP
jgi:hypothetical protein